MITFLDFIKKYEGKFIEAGGSDNARFQCVDLANQFIEEVLGLPKILWTNACDFPTKAGNKYEFIKNTLEGVPNREDLVIWNNSVGGGAGHISIFVDGTAGNFTSFDQNWPTGTPCHLQGHYYTNVLGWMHPLKGENNMSNYYKGIDLTNIESVKICVDAWKDISDNKYVKKEDYQKLTEDLSREIEAGKVRIKEEKDRYDNFVKKLGETLNCPQDEPRIIESITKAIQSEDKVMGLEKEVEKAKLDLVEAKKSGEVIVKPASHSRLCAWLANKGL